MHIFVTDLEGQEHRIDAVEGWRVMELIRDQGIPIVAECGGSCCCATCHVYIAPEWADKIHPPREDEEDMLDQVPSPAGNSRLSCQIIFTEELNGLKLRLAPISLN